MNDMKDIDNEEFLILSELLDLGDETGEARAAAPLSDEEKELLQKLARGACNKDEKKKATVLAASNATAMEFLAECIKKAAT